MVQGLGRGAGGTPFGTTPTPYKFTGQREERDLGLYWIGFRMYDPLLGRWLQPDTIVPDPSNPQSLNRYAYSYGNPLKYTDPSGHFAIIPLLIAGAAGGLVAGIIDVGKQLIVDQTDIQHLNLAEVGGSVAGGFVAGATLGLAPAGAGLGMMAFLGGGGGIVGGQVSAVTEAALEEPLGMSRQGNLIEEAKRLGFLDPGTVIADGVSGAVMASVGGKVAQQLRNKLKVPTSARVIERRAGIPKLQWTLRLDQPGIFTSVEDGRILRLDATVVEKILQSMAMGTYDRLSEIIQEAMQEGLAEWIESEVDPFVSPVPAP